MEGAQLPSGFKVAKPRTFNGDRQVATIEAWLHAVFEYTYGQGLTGRAAVGIAATFLDKKALLWWSETGSKYDYSTFDHFVYALRKTFYPPDHERIARDKLDRLKQRGSVRVYIENFREIALELVGVTEMEKVRLFEKGLKKHVMALYQVREKKPCHTV